MKISGFTLIRNGTQFEYPYLESLRSMLPLVDQLVINVGISEDNTLEVIEEFCRTEGKGKATYFTSDWQLHIPEKKKGGLILSEQTNLALACCVNDWCVYLQADEVLSESDLPLIQKSIEQSDGKSHIEGLLFDYVHFYGSYDVIQKTRSAYRREVRVVRKSAGVKSVGDAQSFRKADGSKLNVVHSKARIFHYGWVRTPEAMREKTFFFDQLYHGEPSPDSALQRIPHTGDNYRYKRIWGLQSFKGQHPRVMHERIGKKGWHWDLAHSPLEWTWKDAKKIVLDIFERVTGHRFFEYRSYRMVKNGSPKN